MAEVSSTEPSAAVSGDASASSSKISPAQAQDNNSEGSDDDLEDEGPVVPPVPDGGWGWMVVLGSFMIHVICDGIAYSFGVLVEDFVEYFECSKSAVGGLGSLMLGVTWGSGPIASALTNKFGCRVVAIAGTLIASFGFIISIWAPNIWFMYFSLGCVAGLGMGMAYLPAIVAVSFYFEKRRSLATGIAVCGSGIGTFIFAPMTNTLLAEYSWKGTVLIEAGFMFNCILCGMLFRPLKFPENPDAAEEEEPVVEEKPTSVVKANEPIMEMKRFSVPIPHKSVALAHDDDAERRPSELRRMSRRMSRRESLRRMSLTHLAGPMARKDIFYRKSLHNIALYRQDRDEYFFRLSISEPPKVPAKKNWLDRIGITADIRQTITEMMDFRLLLNVIFIFFAVANLCTSIGFVVPYIFLPSRGRRLGFDSNQASWLISVIGISNTVGRVIFGYVSDKKCVNRVVLYSTVLVLCGVCSVLSVFLWTFPLQMCYSFTFGFFIGVYVLLTPTVLVDLLGLEKLSNAFGLVLLFQGIGTVVGPPLAGWLFDMSKSYDYSFYMMGICLILSGKMLYPILCIQRCGRLRLGEEEEPTTETDEERQTVGLETIME